MDEQGGFLDTGELSGRDRLLLALAVRYGPEAQELCLYYLKIFFELRRKGGESWGGWIQRFFMVYADTESTGLRLNIFG